MDDSLPTQFGGKGTSTSAGTTSHTREVDLETFRLDPPDPSFPFKYETTLVGPTKWVACLDIDPPGVRCVAGSYDNTIKLYDFAGMVHGKPFRSIDLGLPVLALHWSLTGDTFLAAPASSQPRLYDRNGQMISEFNKGDMYIRDPRHTDGHTGALTALQWSPTDRNLFASSSADSTIRIWDIQQTRKQRNVIVFKYGSGARGSQAKAPVTTLAYSQDGEWIAGGCQDGSLRIWKAKGPYLLPPHQTQAHTDALVSIHFSLDGTSLLTRSMDQSLRQWDLRRLKTPLHTLQVPTTGVQNARYSPDDTHIALGSEHTLLMYAKDTFEKTAELHLGAKTPTYLTYGTKHQQFFLGTHQGTICGFFNHPKGVAMHLLAPPPKVDDLQDLLLQRAEAATIFVPGAERKSHFQLTAKVSKRQYEKMRQDPRATRMPERPKPPKPAPTGGVVSSKASSLRDVDPRQALLEYAEKAANDPYWVAPAYQKTQPTPTLAKSVLDQDEEARVLLDEERQRGKRRKF